ncbi:dehydrodolichyl diphosphate synthase CPT3-like [Corylus avellana]|uniref:dehydrodolichyl diphosphate synthase CPT3-like n=1 Tax=Corylus avellana TaxID=13451 RepID=UPI001E231806|nr:dehydrodolichyl diphosphate synthase CPT3-like [Corylus avellana]XP_059437339.1 dehydrodolichyl diphosphate synthase CPT3-like [Corylus avellana]XP_059437340.1 dehydrodolichyl diphosphate synthase CPT3-like [Corylus avellana]XP_059437341.1 dehydrodolichyl diphosphate synthase CPT3-like [Corylus avellana]
MEKARGDSASQLAGGMGSFLRKCIFSILSVGPLPNHIALIMDGNRRYAKKQNMAEVAGHKAGFIALMKLLSHSYELGVKYVTVYAFSIDNFKRRPDEVNSLMALIVEKIEELLNEGSIVSQYDIRMYFIGNLKLLNEPVRVAAERAMAATANNTKAALLICVAYTSCDEIVHAVQESCKAKWIETEALGVIEGNHEESKEKQLVLPTVKVLDIEKHMYMSVAPEPDILIRTSGENRLSNFLLWQTTNCPLYSPTALWPEFSFWHFLWAVLNFQRSYQYFEKKKKQL